MNQPRTGLLDAVEQALRQIRSLEKQAASGGPDAMALRQKAQDLRKRYNIIEEPPRDLVEDE